MVSSLLIPLAVTIVLLGINLTGCHGNLPKGRNHIHYNICSSRACLIANVVMGIILCHRACRKRNALLSEYDLTVQQGAV